MALFPETGRVGGGEGWKEFFISHGTFQVLLRHGDGAVKAAGEAKSGILGRGQDRRFALEDHQGMDGSKATGLDEMIPPGRRPQKITQCGPWALKI